MIRLRSMWNKVRESYWFIPSVLAAVSVGLAFGMVSVDDNYRMTALRKQGWIYSGGPEGARAVLSTIAGSIITVAGTIFSITIAVLSLATAQFGPRLLRNFMRDRANQFVLGTFTSTFLYCILVLRTVRGAEDETYVPHFSVTLGVVLAISSLGVLIYFIHHTAESIQVGYVVDVVGRDVDDAVRRLFPAGISEAQAQYEGPPTAAVTVPAKESGYIQEIDQRGLLALNADLPIVLEVVKRPGDYVNSGVSLVLSSKELTKGQCATIVGAFVLGRARTPSQDAVYAFLQLADIALRALSPSINDPFTANMCLDRITGSMILLAERSLPPPIQVSESGNITIIARPYSYDDLIEAGYEHIRRAAGSQWEVSQHLHACLEELSERVRDPEMLKSVMRLLGSLRGELERNHSEP